MSKLKVLRCLSAMPALACWLWMTSAGATTVVAQGVPELTREASRIVRARVVGTTSEWISEGRLVSRVTLEVADDWKGAGAKRIVLVQPGGEKDGLVQRVSGLPLVRTDDELVAFLQPSRNLAGDFEVVGFSQGLFRVEQGGNAAERRVESAAGKGLIRVDPVSRQIVSSTVLAPTSLETLRRQVRAVLDGSAP